MAKKEKVQTMEVFSDAIGLSRPTVSRYFSDPQSVRKSTRKIIETGLEQFGYRPNFYASNLSRRKTRVIGIIVPSILDPFYSELVNTIEIHAEKHGYLTILQCSHHDPKMERLALARLRSMNIAGIAMSSLGAVSNIDALKETQADVPVIFIDSPPAKNTPYFGTNNRQSIPMMIDYLCHSGTPPVFFGLPPLSFNIVLRQDAYFDHMKKLGLEPTLINPDPIPVKDNFERFGFEQFMILSRDRLPKGSTILCFNDRVAFGVISAATKLGIKVGKTPQDDMRVAGHDNQHFSKYTTPSLTTVAQDTKRIGILAAQALIDKESPDAVANKGQLINGTIQFRESA